MGRQWRIEFAGAFYHILYRGNEGRDIFYNDEDRYLFFDTPADMPERFDLRARKKITWHFYIPTSPYL